MAQINLAETQVILVCGHSVGGTSCDLVKPLKISVSQSGNHWHFQKAAQFGHEQASSWASVLS